ncbi:hypothetical protein [Streptomyces sp. 4F14]|uniref:hypothetical protein n=1 Tax=Streptomyces sp. 4F14 TaxID=3394380 RepID=UPI003A88A453
MTVSTEPGSEFDPARVLDHAAERSIGHLRIAHATGTAFTASAPEWTPDAAAWITELVVNSLRNAGAQGSAVITVSAS